MRGFYVARRSEKWISGGFIPSGHLNSIPRRRGSPSFQDRNGAPLEAHRYGPNADR
jgi:hypothetical protein